VSQTFFDNPGFILRAGGVWLAFGYQWKIDQSIKPMGLETPFPLIETGAVHPAFAASFGNVSQRFRLLNHLQSFPGKFDRGILLGRFVHDYYFFCLFALPFHLLDKSISITA